jgi:hypothetical protein
VSFRVPAPLLAEAAPLLPFSRAGTPKGVKNKKIFRG